MTLFQIREEDHMLVFNEDTRVIIHRKKATKKETKKATNITLIKWQG